MEKNKLPKTLTWEGIVLGAILGITISSMVFGILINIIKW